MAQSNITVALTGATGFVGRHVLPILLEKGFRVRVLVRDASKLTMNHQRILPVHGDLFDQGAITRLLEDAQAVIHLVGIIMETPHLGQTFDRVHRLATERLLASAIRAKVPRWIQMSALGTRPDATSNYHRTKWEAEQAIRESGIEHTIFRPSIIHGHDGEFMQMVKGFWCDALPPFIPYFGRGLSAGEYIRLVRAMLTLPKPAVDQGTSSNGRVMPRAEAGKLQPVWVDDVARCMVESLDRPSTIHEIYPMGGPQEYTWAKLYSVCGQYLSQTRPKPILAVPVWAAGLIAGKPGVPFSAAQVTMSQEDSTCDIQKVQSEFDIKLAPFESTYAQYVDQI
jgi:uncharacterized protein YbjT (DUF2867 family)